MARSCIGIVSRNPEIVKWGKKWTIQLKIPVKSVDPEIPDRSFPKNTFRTPIATPSLHGCFLFRKFQKMLLQSSLEISRNPNRNLSSNWKRPIKQLIHFLSDLRSLFLIYLTNKEASTVPIWLICSVLKQAGSGRARKKYGGKHET